MLSFNTTHFGIVKVGVVSLIIHGEFGHSDSHLNVARLRFTFRLGFRLRFEKSQH